MILSVGIRSAYRLTSNSNSTFIEGRNVRRTGLAPRILLDPHIKYAVALFGYYAANSAEVSLERGQQVVVLLIPDDDRGFWMV